MSVVSSKALALFLSAFPNLAQRLKFSLETDCSFGNTFERGLIDRTNVRQSESGKTLVYRYFC